jgi:hypothetical protein
MLQLNAVLIISSSLGETKWKYILNSSFIDLITGKHDGTNARFIVCLSTMALKLIEDLFKGLPNCFVMNFVFIGNKLFLKYCRQDIQMRIVFNDFRGNHKILWILLCPSLTLLCFFWLIVTFYFDVRDRLDNHPKLAPCSNS